MIGGQSVQVQQLAIMSVMRHGSLIALLTSKRVIPICVCMYYHYNACTSMCRAKQGVLPLRLCSGA